jgi:hypothetical protein
MFPLRAREGTTMKRTQPDPNKSNQSPRWAPVNRPGVTEFIRAAENFVQARKYVAALEQLARAQRIEPGNKYIAAIIERVESLQRNNPATIPTTTFDAESSADSARYLSITVGNQYDTGIKPEESQSAASPSAPYDLVKELTDIAQELANLGLPEPAFDALMRAYLLDPLSPDVIACEKTIVPLWNSARSQNGSLPRSAEIAEPAISGPAPVIQPETEQKTRSPETDEERLEMLKQEKEIERVEKEREIWREASRVPRIFKLNPWDDSQHSPSIDSNELETPRGLFKKRRRKNL